MENNKRENFHASPKMLSRLPTPLIREPLFYTIKTKNVDVVSSLPIFK